MQSRILVMKKPADTQQAEHFPAVRAAGPEPRLSALAGRMAVLLQFA